MLRVLNDMFPEDVVGRSTGVNVASLLEQFANELSTVENDKVCGTCFEPNDVAVGFAPLGEFDVEFVGGEVVYISDQWKARRSWGVVLRRKRA